MLFNIRVRRVESQNGWSILYTARSFDELRDDDKTSVALLLASHAEVKGLCVYYSEEKYELHGVGILYVRRFKGFEEVVNCYLNRHNLKAKRMENL